MEGNRTEGRVKLCFTTTEEEPNSSDALELHGALSQMTEYKTFTFLLDQTNSIKQQNEIHELQNIYHKPYHLPHHYSALQ